MKNRKRSSSSKLKIGVLMGGLSSEREVSLRSGRAIANSLERLGFRVERIDLRPEVYSPGLEEKKLIKTLKLKPVIPSTLSGFLRKRRFDCLFLALHGGIGENGAIQGFLEVMGIPYTGSGIMASSLAMDKLISKRLFKSAGLNVADFMIIDEGYTESPENQKIFEGAIDEREIVNRLGLPLVVKPVHEGSSVGVSIVEAPSELAEAIAEAKKYGQCIVERYIKGKEIHVGVLGDRAIGAVEVRPRERFYSYKAKYTPGMTDYIIPPEIPEAMLQRVLQTGLLAHRALGCRGATRVDLIITDRGEPFVLEVNTIPGMTETSLLPKIAASAGISFDDLVKEILFDALKKA
ncbi:MAG: D-alanine--D-alanine ligase [Thermodesulfovibrionales bacterium]